MNAIGKPKHIGRNIKRLRELKGIKQEVLALALGLSIDAVREMEACEFVQEENLIKVAKALDISVDAIKNFAEESKINYVNTFNNPNFSNSIANFSHNYQCVFNPIDKVVELFEKLLQTERDKVEKLQEENNRLIEENRNLIAEKNKSN